MVRMTISAIALLLLTGCAGLDPLGSVEPNPETGESSLDVVSGYILREIRGSVDGGAYANGQAQGLRVLRVGEGEFLGCVEFDNGLVSFRSPGCSKGPD